MKFETAWLALGVSIAAFCASGCAMDTSGVGESASYATSADSTEAPAVDSQQQAASAAGAYGWLSSPAEGGTPVSTTSFNSANGANTVVKTALGTYTARFPKLQTKISSSFGYAMVTAAGINLFGPPPADRCKIMNWSKLSDAMEVQVRCTNIAGNAVDSPFVASIYDRSTNQDVGAYTSVKSDGTASAGRSWTSGTGFTYQHPSAGKYTVTLRGLASIANSGAGAQILVTAVGGTNGNYCKIEGETGNTTDARVLVACYNNAGTPVDQAFAIDYGTRPRSPGMSAWSYNNNPSLAGTHATVGYSDAAGAGGAAAAPTMTRNSAGVYWANYPFIPAVNESSSQVTAYGTNPNFCKVGMWFAMPNNAGATASVYCFTPAGVPVDSIFIHQYAYSRFIAF